MSGLIRFQTVWHSDGIPEGIFWKNWFWKKQQPTKKCEKLSSRQSVSSKQDTSIPWEKGLTKWPRHVKHTGGLMTVVFLWYRWYCLCLQDVTFFLLTNTLPPFYLLNIAPGAQKYRCIRRQCLDTGWVPCKFYSKVSIFLLVPVAEPVGLRLTEAQRQVVSPQGPNKPWYYLWSR